MAVSLVLGTLSTLQSRKELQVESPRAVMVLKYRDELIVTVQKEENMDKFAEFSVHLLELLRSCIHQTGDNVTLSTMKDNTCVKYALLRQTSLPLLWKQFLLAINCLQVAKEPLLMEIVNEAIFEGIVREMFASADESASAEVQLTMDEANILRYACGFVGMKLHRKFLKMKGSKAAQFTECLNNFQVEGTTSNLLEYTKNWIVRVNRGGLFEVSDNAYFLFVAIESSMRNKLTEQLKKSIRATSEPEAGAKSGIVSFVCNDAEVDSYWSGLSADITDDQHSKELLREIVGLWLNIRGFSISKSWIEDYKQEMCISNARKKSLRKELKKKSKDD